MRVFLTLLLSIPLFLGAELFTSGDTQLALKGYDVVTYHEEKTPMLGAREFTTRYKNAQWRFVSTENLEKFIRNPEQYAPKYDGWCAWAVANGNLSPSNPNFWILQDNKLYMMCSEQAIKSWLENPQGNQRKADANWPILRGGPVTPAGYSKRLL